MNAFRGRPTHRGFLTVSGPAACLTRAGHPFRAVLRGRSFGSDRGATAVEYSLMVALIAVVIIGGVSLFGQSVSALFIIPAGVL